MKIDGRCHCGRISFTAEVDPARVAVCNCADCQVLSGSAFRVSVPAPVERFALRGEPKRYVKVAQSGNHRVQAFCPDCGTPLFASATEGATQVMIRTGCVVQRAELEPREQIWTASALPWVSRVHALPDAGQR
ncbi:MAG TPA: GFA family protein [Zeimonas sp.]